MKIDKLKELVLVLVSIVLIVFLIKYLKIFKYLKNLFVILIPLFIGFIYAWMFRPLLSKMEKLINRNCSCIILFLVIILLFSLVIYCLVPMFYREIMELVEMFPIYFSKIEVKVESIGLKGSLDKIVSFIVNNVPSYLLSMVSCIFKYIGVVIIGLILGFVSVVSKNIWPSIIIHFMNNAISTYIDFASAKGWVFGDILDHFESFLLNNNPVFVFVTVAVTMIIVVLLWK